MKRNALLGIVCLLAGCTEDSPLLPQNSHGAGAGWANSTITSQLLKKGKWVLSAYTVSPALNGETDLFISYPTCSKDDTLFFKEYYKAVRHNASTACSTNDTTTFHTWELKTNNLLLFDISYMDVKSISADSLVLQTKEMVNSMEYTYRKTYVNRK